MPVKLLVSACALAIAANASAEVPRVSTTESKTDSDDRGELEDRSEIDAPPAPGEASGMEVEPEGPSPFLWIPRVALFVPRLALEAINAPIRGALYLSDRYQLDERAIQLFFDDTETYGLYPIGFFESGFGFSIGARAVHRDMFGGGESASASALYGGRYNQEYNVDISSGARFGRLELGLEGVIERRPRERFFGIGNGDVVAAAGMSGIDPTTDPTAVATRFRQNSYDAALTAEVALGSDLYAGATSRLERRRFARSENLGGDAALADVYDPMAVSGFSETLDSSYNELELKLDTRRPDNRYVSAAMPSDGVMIAARVGYNAGFGGGASREYVRFTGDAQLYLDLYEGTRVLGLRLLASQVSADLDEIPFVYLPALGGDTLLRGYQTDRFRDRALTLGSVEYKFELAPQYAAAYVFTDVGRVQRSLADPQLDNLRVGFGAGLQVHTLTTFITRVHVASSNDGGVFLNIDFDPVTEARVREE